MSPKVTALATAVALMISVCPAVAAGGPADPVDEKATRALKEASEAKELAEEAKLDELKSGKFIQYGITAGYSFVIQTQSIFQESASAEQESFASTTMPYVLLVPAYWWLGDITRAYCAAEWGADAVLAQKRANRLAEQLTFEMTGAQYTTDGATGEEGLWVRDKDKDGNPTKVWYSKRQYIHSVTNWNANARGRCVAAKGGVWIGKPLPYDASVVDGRPGGAEYKHQVDPSFALGVAYTPNAYVTALVGLSFNHLKIDGKPATATEPAVEESLKRFVTVVFALGGNLDILGILLKK